MIDGPRGLKAGELDELIELTNTVFKSNMGKAFPTLFCEENFEYTRVIKADGKIVSHIGIVVRDMIINGCRISSGNVGAVCTYENYRKRGYAWSIMDDAIEKCRADGVDIFLISGGRSLYYKHGAAHTGTLARYRLAPEMSFAETEASARPFSQDDLPEWAALHRNEPIRFQRPYNDFRELTLAVPEFRRRSLYSIWKGDRIAAYAVLARSRSDSGESVYIEEYAGSRRLLLGAMSRWCAESDLPSIGALVPMHDLESIDLLESAGAAANYDNARGIIIVINFPRLCDKLRLMFEEIIGRETAQKLTFREQNGLYAIGLDGDEITFSDAHDVARLIFGNPANRDEKTEILAEGKLREVLETIFPIPRPEYGLSYI